jgi:septum site-determining protein MinC
MREVEMNSPASFKGTDHGIIVLLNPEFFFDEILSYLSKILDERRVFFSGANLIVEPNGVLLSEQKIGKLSELFKKFGITFSIEGMGKISQKEVLPLENKKEGGTTIIPHTLRAGQVINFDGNVVILGDINEGAEVNVTGSVYVFGIVRGIVNAGNSVVSLGFMPLRMMIGKVVFDNSKSGKTYRKPRIAKVENGKIEVKVLGEKKSIRR